MALKMALVVILYYPVHISLIYDSEWNYIHVRKILNYSFQRKRVMALFNMQWSFFLLLNSRFSLKMFNYSSMKSDNSITF